MENPVPYSALLVCSVPMTRQKFYSALADFGGIARFLPEEVENIVVTGAGVGCVREVTVKGIGGVLRERLDALVDQRLVSYSIINDAQLPLERYVAVVELEDNPAGGCNVRWGSNWVAKGAETDAVSAMLCALYQRIIDGVLAHSD